jgi:glycosyltransferase involved in cell wall biosynthesis
VAEVRPRSILFVGRFDLLKGGDLILETFRRLADNYHDVSLTFVGSDDGLPKNDGFQISFSEFAATHIPTKHRARLEYHGALTPAEVHRLRRSHFLTVVASRQEVMPYSVLETMAFGAPIIATAVGGIPEIVLNGVNGLLVPPTAEGLTAACEVLFRDPELAERLGQQARIDTANRSPLLIAQKTLDLYTNVIEQFQTQSR